MSQLNSKAKLNDTHRLIVAYKELLKLNSSLLRSDLNDAFCLLRDTISVKLGLSAQETQETFEEQALLEKHDGK